MYREECAYARLLPGGDAGHIDRSNHARRQIDDTRNFLNERLAGAVERNGVWDIPCCSGRIFILDRSDDVGTSFIILKCFCEENRGRLFLCRAKICARTATIDTRFALICHAVSTRRRFIKSGSEHARKEGNDNRANNQQYDKSSPRGPAHAASIAKHRTGSL